MSITDKIAAAGVVGCGGAGFPTHAKLKGTFEHLIINGAECEPLLRTDRYIMLNKADELVRALCAITKELNIPHCTIALKADYRDEIASLEQAIAKAGADIAIHQMESFYPAGDEQTIVYEVTGRVVPPAGIPGMVGCVVDNIATILAVNDAMDGTALTQKYLTVTGEVHHPVVLRVPVGTSFTRCIELAGGALHSDYFVVSGGPMMGKPLTKEQAEQEVVTKTTSGILILPAEGYHATQERISIRHMLNRAKSACIQCTACSQLCPRHMLGHPIEPHRIMRKMAMANEIGEDLNDPIIRNAALCCECGVCEAYACPMGLQPRKINSLLKKELGAAGIRYARPDGAVYEADPQRDSRKVPSKRLAARVEVLPYYHYTIRDLVEDQPDHVRIPLKMHIGAPSVPVVAVGDRVTAGQLIASFPNGTLGSNIHASISGRIVSISDTTIEISSAL